MCRHTCRGCKELCCFFVFLKSDCLSDLCVIFICAAPPWITPIFSSVPGSATSFPGGRRGISHLFNILTLLIWEISLAFATFPHSDFSIFWPIIRDITATQIFIFFIAGGINSKYWENGNLINLTFDLESSCDSLYVCRFFSVIR